MSRFDPEPRHTPDTRVDVESATRLLRLGIAGPARPVDALVLRLQRPDADRWLADVLAHAIHAPPADCARTALGGGVPLDALERMKAESKSAAAALRTEEDALRATAQYFLSVAIALAAHGARISSGRQETLHDALADLAGAAPGLWGEIFLRAAEAGESQSS